MGGVQIENFDLQIHNYFDKSLISVKISILILIICLIDKKMACMQRY
jgi:hypothetical protein